MARRFERGDDVGIAVAGGMVAGIVGGLVMNVIVVMMTVAAGGEAWQALKGAGTPFLGTRSAQPGFDPFAVTIGLASHYAVSIGWGVLFGLLAYGLTRGMTLIAGILYGIVVWLGMYYVVLPLVGLGAMREQGQVGMTVLFHMLFGLGLAIGFLPFQLPTRSRPPRMRAPVTP